MKLQDYRTMKIRNCYLFVFDGFADWEPSLAVAGLNQFTDFNVKTVAVEKKIVRSMGNVAVMPDLTLDDLDMNRVDLLLLPGGTLWEKGGNLEIKFLLDQVIKMGKTVAAICGATSFLAQHGYLDSIRHTSNNLEYYLLQVAPDYQGAEWYVDDPVVVDQNIITAKGTAMVEFAEAIFKQVNVMHDERLRFWFNFFLNAHLV
jgi:putative intracellular protease/amidase